MNWATFAAAAPILDAAAHVSFVAALQSGLLEIRRHLCRFRWRGNGGDIPVDWQVDTRSRKPGRARYIRGVLLRKWRTVDSAVRTSMRRCWLSKSETRSQLRMDMHIGRTRQLFTDKSSSFLRSPLLFAILQTTNL